MKKLGKIWQPVITAQTATYINKDHDKCIILFKQKQLRLRKPYDP